MLNTEIDIASAADSLRKTGRVVIREVFDQEQADRIHQCLGEKVPWRLAYRDMRVSGANQQQQLTQEQFAALGPERAAALRAMVFSQARDHYQYLYQHFNIGGGQKTGEASGMELYELFDYLRSAPFMKFVHELTGDAEINDVYAHATLYTAGNFLKIHQDVTNTDDRRFAYVFGFTRDWQADMGGLTHFLDDNGNVVETFVPGYNTLTIFSVPVSHLVSQVSPWVRQRRLAVTGWLIVEDAD
jgi:Rps23 Pro-64 3,4-dihydroxylase Tpa1-like proline 4-hydroxylase